MNDDAKLLRAYLDGSEPAFSSFVERHLGFVYHTALRRTGGNVHRAAEVAQVVFTDAARHAAALSRHQAVAGWLHVATRHAVIDLARAEARRKKRELEAEIMSASTAPAPSWENLKLVIDTTLDELGRSDRDAVLARFFENRSFAEIGDRLKISENAARMRVDRALGKLRDRLKHRGITSTSAALAIVLAEQSYAAVPSGLASGICSAVLANAVPTSTGLLAFLAMNKLQAIAASIIIAALIAPPAIEWWANQSLRAELTTQRTARAVVQKTSTQLVARLKSEATHSPDGAELARWRLRAAVLRARPDGVLESEMHPLANKGWETPAAMFETMLWAMQNGDWEIVSRGFNLDVATKIKADAFFAGLAPEIRERYGTAERFFAHAWCQAASKSQAEWIAAMQVFETKRVDGPAPLKVRMWGRDRTGKESGADIRFERQGTAWALSPEIASGAVRRLIATMDPVTGSHPPKKS